MPRDIKRGKKCSRGHDAWGRYRSARDPKGHRFFCAVCRRDREAGRPLATPSVPPFRGFEVSTFLCDEVLPTERTAFSDIYSNVVADYGRVTRRSVLRALRALHDAGRIGWEIYRGYWRQT